MLIMDFLIKCNAVIGIFSSLFVIQIFTIRAAPYKQLVEIPATSFSCKSRSAGYYADPDPVSKCQVYHMCDITGVKYSYLCPNRTLFDQEHLTCAHWYDVECDLSTEFYSKNDRLFGQNQNKVRDASTSSHVLNNKTSKARTRKRIVIPRRRVRLPSRPARPGEPNTFLVQRQPLPLNSLPRTNSTQIIGVSITSSVQAKTDPIPVFLNQNISQQITTENSSESTEVPTTSLRPSTVPEAVEIPSTSDPHIQADITEPGALSRNEFFERISGIFGQKLKPISADMNESITPVSTTTTTTAITTTEVTDTITSQHLTRAEFIDLVNASRVFIPPQNNQNDDVISQKKVYENVSNSLDVQLELSTESSTSVITSPTEHENFVTSTKSQAENADDLVTGDHGTVCKGCMKYFIQDMDNCFPCVYPR